MLVPQRNYQSPAYRYGFQGQEKDDEIKGFGNSINYKYRMHDSRVGRFFAVDPLMKKYPYYSPYQFSGNRLIDMVELEGAEPNYTPDKEGTVDEAPDKSDNDCLGIDCTETYHPMKTWIYHTGGVKTNDGKLTKPGWMLMSGYVHMLKPIINSGAGLYIESTPFGEYLDFITSRNFADEYPSFLGESIRLAIQENQRIKAYMASGHIETKDFDSPVFLFSGALRKFAFRSLINGTEEATVGLATTKNYRQTFFKEYPELEGKVVVHHAVEQQVLNRFGTVFKELEIHSLENLRGIPLEVNSRIHLSEIRKAWNRFYKAFPNPTRQQILDKATEIDNIFGNQFLPRIRN